MEATNQLLDYNKLKEAVLSIPHLTLVHQIIYLFSKNKISLELGLKQYLGRDTIEDWKSRIEDEDVIPFLDNADSILEG